MKKNKLSIGIIAVSLSFLLTGCGGQYANLSLTPEEQKIVVEYAAGTLMKYNAGSNMRVLTGAELEQAEAEDAARREQEARRQQLAEEYQNGISDTEGDDSTTADGDGSAAQDESQTLPAIQDLGTFLAQENFSITYEYYEVADSYTGTEEASMMAMDASTGKKLLIAHFTVTNNSSETAHLDILSQDGKFQLNIGGETIQSEYTLLLNDLSMYKEDVEAGASIDTVLVFEVTEEQSTATDLQIQVTLGEAQGSIVL